MVQEVTRKIEESLTPFQGLVLKWRFNLRERREVRHAYRKSLKLLLMKVQCACCSRVLLRMQELARNLVLPAFLVLVLAAVAAVTAWKLLGLVDAKQINLEPVQIASPVLAGLIAFVLIYQRIAKVVLPISEQLASYFKLAPQHRQQLGYQHKVGVLSNPWQLSSTHCRQHVLSATVSGCSHAQQYCG